MPCEQSVEPKGSFRAVLEKVNRRLSNFPKCRVFSVGMKIVIDKNLENTIWLAMFLKAF
jgi:hypothetical protein